MFDLIVKNVNVVTEKDIFFGAVAVKDGKIAALIYDGDIPEAKETVDGKGYYLIPGGVDPHVHIRYPGGSHRETFLTVHRQLLPVEQPQLLNILFHTTSYSVEILNNRVETLKDQAIVDEHFGAAGGEKLSTYSLLEKQEL